MNNKNVLQLITGVLLFLSFFSSWLYNGGFSYYKPTEFIFVSNAPIAFKLLLLLPVLGIAAGYKAYIKQYSYRLNIGITAVSFFAMWSVLGYINKDNGLVVHTGFYLTALAMLVSIASIVVMKKEIKTNSDVSSHS